MDEFTCGLGVFHAIDWIPPAEVPDKDYPLYLTTGRVLYQYHTGTMTMKTDGLNQLAPECFVEISAGDASRYELQDGQEIEVASRRGAIRAKTKISGKAVDGTVFIPLSLGTGCGQRVDHAALDPTAKIRNTRSARCGFKSAGERVDYARQSPSPSDE